MDRLSFKPVLSFWALVLFGLATVGPTAHYAFFGVGAAKSHGHFALVYLIGMVAISFTAMSYGRMASIFPVSGSTYTYASKALQPILGFFAGWAIGADRQLWPLEFTEPKYEIFHQISPLKAKAKRIR